MVSFWVFIFQIKAQSFLLSTLFVIIFQILLVLLGCLIGLASFFFLSANLFGNLLLGFQREFDLDDTMIVFSSVSYDNLYNFIINCAFCELSVCCSTNMQLEFITNACFGCLYVVDPY